MPYLQLNNLRTYNVTVNVNKVYYRMGITTAFIIPTIEAPWNTFDRKYECNTPVMQPYIS